MGCSYLWWFGWRSSQDTRLWADSTRYRMGQQSNFQQGKKENVERNSRSWQFTQFQDGGDIGDEIGEYTRESWEVSQSISKSFQTVVDVKESFCIPKSPTMLTRKKKFLNRNSFYLFFHFDLFLSSFHEICFFWKWKTPTPKTIIFLDWKINLISC